jgi:hypothetical protein
MRKFTAAASLVQIVSPHRDNVGQNLRIDIDRSEAHTLPILDHLSMRPIPEILQLGHSPVASMAERAKI